MGSTACASSRRSRGTLHLSRTNAFFLGGGKALVNAYYRAAERARHRGAVRRRGDRRRSCDGDASIARRGRATACEHVVAGEGGRRSPPAASKANLDWLQGGLGRRRRQLPHPRHAVQQGRVLQAAARRRARKQIGDPTQCHCGRDRRARAEVRRRHRHAPRLRLARHRRQQARRSASTTRARTSGRSATRSGAASSRSSPTRSPTRSSTPSRWASSCRRCSRRSRRASIGEPRRAARARRRTRSRRPSTRFNAAVRPGTFDHTDPRRLRDRGPRRRRRPTGRAASTRRPSSPIRCAPASRSPISASRSTSARACVMDDGSAVPQRLRRRRDHGRQHPAARATRRLRHDDRHRVRPHRRARRPRAMSAEPLELAGAASREARAHDAICNACRYCEGYCAVFPAMERRLDVRSGATPTTWPTSATTAASACTRASTRRRTSSTSISRACSRRCASRPGNRCCVLYPFVQRIATPVVVRPPVTRFSTRAWRSAKAATCGRWVTQMT